MSQFALTIHPDDVDLWRQMTGRDETTARPVSSRASLDHMLESAKRNGVRITGWREVDADEADQ